MRRDSNSRGCGLASLLDVALILTVSAIAMLAPQKADALPSYARQTGLGCGSCHTEFPQLTPFRPALQDRRLYARRHGSSKKDIRRLTVYEKRRGAS